MSFEKIIVEEDFQLENGKRLPNVEVAYHTFGKLNERKDNVIWVCHALTANSNVFDWWKGLFGEQSLFNPQDYFIVCANFLGSPYGTTHPLSENPATENPYLLDFPLFTIRDMAKLHLKLAEKLHINQINTLIGPSMGGQQALEMAIESKIKIEHLILIATNAKHSAWGIAFNESQRLAIQADTTFFENRKDGGKKGLIAARSIALLSYRTYQSYVNTQSEDDSSVIDNFKASSYQNYQGEKLCERFDAFSYWYLSKAMDSHNILRNRGNIKQMLSRITAKTLVLNMENDVLFPAQEQQELVKYIPDASFVRIPTKYGHDGFLLETKAISEVIKIFEEIKTKERLLAF